MTSPAAGRFRPAIKPGPPPPCPPAGYDLCPDGTTALEGGAYALQRGSSSSAAPIRGIGTGDDLWPDEMGNVFLSRKVCVGQQVGQTRLWIDSEAGGSQQLVNVYDRVAILDPARTPQVIDIYLDHALYRRVRW